MECVYQKENMEYELIYLVSLGFALEIYEV